MLLVDADGHVWLLATAINIQQRAFYQTNHRRLQTHNKKETPVTATPLGRYPGGVR